MRPRFPSFKRVANFWRVIRSNLNFFRIHVLAFTFTPLIVAAIFFGANGANKIDFIDALFLCVSSMTVTGLATVDLSSLTYFQQVLLFLLQCIGTPVVVSWLMVYIRRRYFIKKFEHIVEAEIAKRKVLVEEGRARQQGNWGRRLSRAMTLGRSLSRTTEKADPARTQTSGNNHRRRKSFFTRENLRQFGTDIIRRTDDAPKPVDPSGWISHEPANSPSTSRNTPLVASPNRTPRPNSPESNEDAENGVVSENTAVENLGDSGISTSPEQIESDDIMNIPRHRSGMARTGTLEPRHGGVPLGNTMTVEFKTPEHNRQYDHPLRRPASLHPSVKPRSDRGSKRYSTYGDGMHGKGDAASRRFSVYSGGNVAHDDRFVHRHHNLGQPLTRQRTLDRGYGGFPGPAELVLRFFRRFFPKLERHLVRTVTLPQTQTYQSGGAAEGRRYISFDAIIGRNSKFHLLTEENLQELGGVEYRALTALLWIVGGYHIGIQLIAFTIIAPYISTTRWRSVFQVPNVHRFVPPVWFSAFQVVSAYTNCGTSLVDQSLVPFQKAYPMILTMAFLILAGNTAFPIFLRLTIWIISKLVPKRSQVNDTLHFLLDHPRRCFMYLFPSHQTWFLLTVLVMLNVTDWFFFLVLDIGNPAFASIKVGTRFVIGLLQATAVRAAGFATVSLSALAPAVQTLYVLMMYISVYPIAMSVRSTNVYEEKSLGVFDDDAGSDDDSEEPSGEGDRVAVWGRYLAWHARRQLAFDMWWLGLALFLVCIIEKSKIEDETNFAWFTIFSIIFELISAYGTVGLSLGTPLANYSLSGAFSPLSKLIVCAVMIRGRHRGLPVAIDRAVLLPSEYAKQDAKHEDDDALVEKFEPQDLVPVGETNETNETSNSGDNVEDSHALNEGLEGPGGLRKKTI